VTYLRCVRCGDEEEITTMFHMSHLGSNASAVLCTKCARDLGLYGIVLPSEDDESPMEAVERYAETAAAVLDGALSGDRVCADILEHAVSALLEVVGGGREERE